MGKDKNAPRDLLEILTWNSTHRQGFTHVFPKSGQDFGTGDRANRAPQARRTPRDTQELCSMHRTHTEKMFLPEVVAYPFASLGNPRVWTQIMSLGHTNLSYYKAKKQHIQRQNSKRKHSCSSCLGGCGEKKWQLGRKPQKPQQTSICSLFYSGETTALERNILLSLHTRVFSRKCQLGTQFFLHSTTEIPLEKVGYSCFIFFFILLKDTDYRAHFP